MAQFAEERRQAETDISGLQLQVHEQEKSLKVLIVPPYARRYMTHYIT